MDSLSLSEGSDASDDSGIWMSVLKCYICGDLFRKPRVLPCGHTFCSECLLSLRSEVDAEFKRKNKIASVRKGESGIMICPHPNCDYSMRIMNLTRWTHKNKTAEEAIGMLRRKSQEVKEHYLHTPQHNTMSGPVSTLKAMLGFRDQHEQSSTPCKDRVHQEDQPDTCVVRSTLKHEHVADSIYRMNLIRQSHIPERSRVQSWRALATLYTMDLIGEMFSSTF